MTPESAPHEYEPGDAKPHAMESDPSCTACGGAKNDRRHRDFDRHDRRERTSS